MGKKESPTDEEIDYMFDTYIEGWIDDYLQYKGLQGYIENPADFIKNAIQVNHTLGEQKKKGRDYLQIQKDGIMKRGPNWFRNRVDIHIKKQMTFEVEMHPVEIGAPQAPPTEVPPEPPEVETKQDLERIIRERYDEWVNRISQAARDIKLKIPEGASPAQVVDINKKRSDAAKVLLGRRLEKQGRIEALFEIYKNKDATPEKMKEIEKNLRRFGYPVEILRARKILER